MITKINDIYDKYFSKEIYFVVAYTLIHLILIVFAFTGISSPFQPPVFYQFTIEGLNNNLYAGLNGYVYSYLLLLLILIIDVLFLIVLMLEFRCMRLNYKKVLSLEILLLAISFMFPFFREIMFFMSFNTIGIYIIYRLILKNIWYFRFPFIFSSYIFIIRLLLSPLIELYKLNMIVGKI